MKPFFAVLVLGGLCIGASAQVVIDSLRENGRLTWTNSVSNATYRVEWAGSLAGPWQPFSALTNLDSIVASNTSVTVTVPMFYRVVWTDPPPPQPVGDWVFNGYDSFGSLFVTGLVTITTGYSTNGLSWSFGFVPIGTNTLPPFPCSPGTGGWGYLAGFGLVLDLNDPSWSDCGYRLEGTLLGETYFGTWYSDGWAGLNRLGPFVARRQSKDSQTALHTSESRARPTIPPQRTRR
jgi:hypothetical protein